MRKIIYLAVALLAAIVLILRKRKDVHQTDDEPVSPFHGLRNQILELDAGTAGVSEPTANHGVWGVLMETGYAKATVTLVALRDGTASLYFETGGGVIGGAGHEKVRGVAMAMATLADDFVDKCVQAEVFPLPPVGDVVFYILTTNGTFTATAPVGDLGEERHRLSPLFHAGQDVITQLRLTEEASK